MGRNTFLFQITCTLLTFMGSQNRLGVVAEFSECGQDEDWILYKDEKCIKIVNKIVTYNDAKDICIHDSLEIFPILTVNSTEEETFLTQTVFNQRGVDDDIWLGAQRSSNGVDFEWSDRTKLGYSNWKKDHPSSNIKRNCTMMDTHGLWTDVSCSKRNLVVCQKRQKWSPEYVQRIVMNQRKEMQNSQRVIFDMQSQLNNSQQVILDLKKELSQMSNLQNSVNQLIPKVSRHEILLGTKEIGWFPANDARIPGQSFLANGGTKSQPIYVARARFGRSMIIGKLVSKEIYAYIPYKGGEKFMIEYEVMAASPSDVSWVPFSMTPTTWNLSQAVPGGFTENGETLYVGRFSQEGRFTSTGGVNLNQGRLYASYGGVEYNFTSFDILIVN